MLTVVEIGDGERDYWDKAMAGFDIAHPLNAFGWGKVRAIDGWSPAYYLAQKNGVVTGGIMVLTKSLPGTGLSLMYAQRGPVWDPADRETLRILLSRIREEAHKRRAIFLRIDPHFPVSAFPKGEDPFLKEGFISLPYRWSYWNSPCDLFRIDLTKARTVEELYSSMEPDAKRCIRKAKNDGITIRVAESPDELRAFYGILKDLSAKKGFMSRGYEYQKGLWDEFIGRGNGRLFLILNQERIIGGLIAIAFARKCLDMHMCSLYDYRRLQPNDAVVWESIKWAKEMGCLWYSFRGVGSTPGQHKFKKKYGPQVVSLTGYYDLPFHPGLHRLFTLIEFKLLPRMYPILAKLREIVHSLGNKSMSGCSS